MERLKKVYVLVNDWGTPTLAFTNAKKAHLFIHNPENKRVIKKPVSYQFFARILKKNSVFKFETKSLSSYYAQNQIISLTIK